MIVQLLVFTCACALGFAREVPPYKQYQEALDNVTDFLTKNVLSMEGDLPLLNDTRRQYAELFNVINDEAKSQSGCIHEDYFENYQHNVNSSATEGLSDPEAVITEVKNLIELVKNNTKDVDALINNCTAATTNCDEQVDNEIKRHPDSYGKQPEVFFAAGKAAEQLDANYSTYHEVANNFTATNFVINGAESLKDVVFSLADVYRHTSEHDLC